MNPEDLLTKLQAERAVWQDRATEQLNKAEAKVGIDRIVMLEHASQAQYDQGVAWGLYLASTLILQEQLQETNHPPTPSPKVQEMSKVPLLARTTQG